MRSRSRCLAPKANHVACGLARWNVLRRVWKVDGLGTAPVAVDQAGALRALALALADASMVESLCVGGG